jgi:serine O-acetyltransferase
MRKLTQKYRVKETLYAFVTDIDRFCLKPRSRVLIVILTQGLWACAVYRFFYPLVRHRLRIIRQVAHLLSIIAVKWTEIVAGISLSPYSEIGAGLHIDHFGGVVINPRVKIGSNCNICHGVTIGSGGRGFEHGTSLEGVPTIGNRVFIGPGACVFGPITIGNDVAIGANAVVTKSLPDRAVAVGIPAKIISYKGSFQYVNYKTMATDRERQESIRQANATGTQE